MVNGQRKSGKLMANFLWTPCFRMLTYNFVVLLFVFVHDYGVQDIQWGNITKTLKLWTTYTFLILKNSNKLLNNWKINIILINRANSPPHSVRKTARGALLQWVPMSAHNSVLATNGCNQ